MSDERTICLMPRQDAAIAPAIGYIIEKVRVRWDIEHGDVYSMSSKQINGEWVKMYKPTKQGLNKLLMAGGIETVDQSTTQRGESWIWDSKWKGRYTTPAGITIDLEDEYTFDVTIGGARWIKRKEDEIDKIAKKEMNLPWAAKADVVAVARAKMPPERAKEINSVAEAIATKFCVEAAQFGTQRAAAGARNRALRTYFEIRDFTENEVRHSYFEIYRTRVDHEAMREVLGDTGARLLSFAQLLSNTGISDTGQIEALSRVLIEAETHRNVGKDQHIYGDLIENEELFDVPMKHLTARQIMGNVTKLRPELAPLTYGRLATGVGRLLGREYTEDTDLEKELSEGEAQCVLKFYRMLRDNPDQDVEALQRSCQWHVENEVYWDGTILPNPEQPESPETKQE